MRPGAVALLAAAAIACQRSTPLPAPLLTLLPGAFAGGEDRGGERCLSAGQAIEAEVFVHEPTVAFTVRGRAEAGVPLEISFGERRLERRQLSAGETVEATYRTEAAGGDRRLRLAVPDGAPGSFCVTQVALTQP